MSVAALVLGILGVVLSFVPCVNLIGLLCAVLAIIFGGIGFSQAKKSGEGTGMAIAGLVCGIVALLIWIIAYFWVLALFKTGVDALESLENFQ